MIFTLEEAAVGSSARSSVITTVKLVESTCEVLPFGKSFLQALNALTNVGPSDK